MSAPLGSPATSRVRITGTPAADDGGLIEVRDQLGKRLMARYDMRPKATGWPATGETWVAARLDNVWVLDRLLAHPRPAVVQGELAEAGVTVPALLDALAALGVVLDQTTPLDWFQQLVRATSGAIDTLTEWRDLADDWVAWMSTEGDLELLGDLTVNTDADLLGDVYVDGDLTLNGWLDRTAAPAYGSFASGALVTTTTSATFVSISGAVTAASTKRKTATRLRVDLRTSFFVDVANTGWELAIQIGGTDYTVASGLMNVINDHKFVTVVTHITGVAAGSFTAQLRWRRISGTGTMRMDANDLTSVVVEEVV